MYKSTRNQKNIIMELFLSDGILLLFILLDWRVNYFVIINRKPSLLFGVLKNLNHVLFITDQEGVKWNNAPSPKKVFLKFRCLLLCSCIEQSTKSLHIFPSKLLFFQWSCSCKHNECLINWCFAGLVYFEFHWKLILILVSSICWHSHQNRVYFFLGDSGN